MQLQFLHDFVEARPDSAAARLARWIEDLEYVYPGNCVRTNVGHANTIEIGGSLEYELRTFDVRKAEIDCDIAGISASVTTRLDDFVSPYAEQNETGNAPVVSSLTTGERFVCLAAAVRDGKSFEEQRLSDSKSRSRGPPVVKKLSRGVFAVSWAPSRAGEFLLHMKVDGHDINGSPVQVVVTAPAGVAATTKPALAAKTQAVQVDDDREDEEMETAPERLVCVCDEGLVLRAGTSLETIEMGKVGKGAVVESTGEVQHNAEGRWVRVAQSTVDQFVDADLRFMDTWAPVFFYDAFGGEQFLGTADAGAQPPDVLAAATTGGMFEEMCVTTNAGRCARDRGNGASTGWAGGAGSAVHS